LAPGGKSILSGGVLNSSSNPIGDWQGEVEIIIADEASERQTLGQDAGVFSFTAQDRLVFRGKARVANGNFQLEIPGSVRLDEALRAGRVWMYANPESGLGDAGGYVPDFSLGGPAESVSDSNGPSIQLWLNDKNFQSGDRSPPQSYLLATLRDDQGIDLYPADSNTPRLFATLDGELTFDLSGFFLTETDTYTEGSLRFPLFNLSPGPHELRLFAWDNMGNPGTESLQFVVDENTKLQLKNVVLYPNPIREQVQVQFEHNKAGEPVALAFSVYNTAGQLLRELPLSFDFAPERISTISWDGRGKDGNRMSPGIYLYRIWMQSIRDGSQAFFGGKLIIVD
jgi:hypothetical protein